MTHNVCAQHCEQVLDVAKDADDRTIKKAYRKKAASLHPDKVCVRGRMSVSV